MIKRSTLGTGGILMASVIGLVACGGDSSPVAGGAVLPGGGAAAQAGHAAVDPCSLVTRAEAEAAMAEPATGAGVAKGPDECAYQGQATDSDTVTVTLGSPDVLRKVVTGNGVGGTVTTEPVSGVGDEAIYQPGEQVLYVRKGTTAFLIQLATLASIQRGDHGAGAKDADVTLAHAALGRL